VRARLMAQGQDDAGRLALHAQLSALDAACAARLHPNDVRRVARALEIIEITGLTPSELAKRDARQTDLYNTRMFAIDWPREALCRRIDQRVDEMVRAGLFDEVERLTSEPRGLPLSHTASQALGLKEAQSALRGETSRDEAAMLIKQHTRQYAKRQLTWFRGDRRVVWLEAGPVEEMAEQIRRTQIYGTNNKRLGMPGHAD